MPIRIQETGSLPEIEQEISSLESEYSMTSQQFAERGSWDGTVAEFDAIEWNFLLMQKAAMERPDDCRPTRVFSAQCETVISSVDANDVRELIAA
jgi:hypothetical protein